MIAARVREPQIQQILNLDDPVLRNLWVTQAYHELGMALAKALEGDDQQPNATWLAFAVWASKTAGISIRGEELPEHLRALMHDANRLEGLLEHIASRYPLRLLMRILRRVDANALVHVADQTVENVAKEIALGNTLVFQELAPIFARMVTLIEGSEDGKQPDARDFADLLRTVASDPASPPELSEAFANYFRGVLEPGRKSRAELVLLANLQAVLHEQQRLDGPINRAMNAPIREAVRQLFYPWLLRLLPDALLQLFDGPLEEVVGWLTDVWQEAATEQLMTLNTPSGSLHLGDDVPALAGEPLFPVELERLDHPDLDRFARKWDRTGGTGRPSGAQDWGRLDQRMNYIFTLFRSRQQDSAMLRAPFTSAQLADMVQERIPQGPL